MKIEVSPANGWMVPSSCAALSSSRSDVVPTATMRPPPARAAFSALAVAAEMLPHSACILCEAVSSAFTGRKVPAPTCRVIRWMPTPRARSASCSAGVKCNPAVGAATAPSAVANMVW